DLRGHRQHDARAGRRPGAGRQRAGRLSRRFHVRVGSLRKVVTVATGGGPQPASWHEIVIGALKDNDVRLVVHVPDRVLTPLIAGIERDPFFTMFAATREEEALGIVTGAWMGGLRGAVLMQTSGFATIANVLASLVVPGQIPALLFVSERGTLGEFNLGQALVARTMRP